MTTVGEGISALAGKVFNVFKLGAASIVTRVLGAFGLTMVSLRGVVPALKAFLADHANLLPPKVIEFAQAIGLDVAMTVILSALAIKLAFKVIIVPKAAIAAVTGAPVP